MLITRMMIGALRCNIRERFSGLMVVHSYFCLPQVSLLNTEVPAFFPVQISQIRCSVIC